jgi:hypothetical protein
MKYVVLLGGVVGLLLCAGGCSTPGYSAEERNQQIVRTYNYEGAQMVDDIDDVLLMRPPGHLTIWYVQ